MRTREWLAIGSSIGSLTACATTASDGVANADDGAHTSATSNTSDASATAPATDATTAPATASGISAGSSEAPTPGSPVAQELTINPEGLTIDSAKKTVVYDLDARTRSAGLRHCHFNHDEYLSKVGKAHNKPVTVEVTMMARGPKAGTPSGPQEYDCKIVRVVPAK